MEQPKETKNVILGDQLSLYEASQKQPQLMFFLRHKGCTFTKETLIQIAAIENEIIRKGYRIVFVHMSEPLTGLQYLRKYGLKHFDAISDPNKKIYEDFGLKRGRFTQIFGLKAIVKGLIGIFKGRTPSGTDGDGFQMPGVFIYHKGKVQKEFTFDSIADQPDYFALIS